MEYKVLLTVFAAVFVAELGDKTQLATMLFAADKQVSKLTVFAGASLALVLASACQRKNPELCCRYRFRCHRCLDVAEGLTQAND
jgi:hypothetical protein